MPKRLNVKEIPSVEVQGEGSWIKVRRPLVEEIMENQAQEKDREKLGSDKRYEIAVLSALKFVVAWNWVDEDGELLPSPKTAGVHKKLTDNEIEFILVSVFGDKENRKN